MATKSFITDFKLNAKSGYKLINAIENSKKVKHTINQSTTDVTKKEEIDSIMKAFLGED
ncbi:hypothetical protein PQS30_19510 [Bacillus licheniformis]|uniref:Uncharacterized protein n=1 Tax=Bacillus glycinifermentans TaxID=1664069 RepID=A0ABU6GWW7_9BACI|nr:MULTISPECIES: hypothetical protein [Bacillus]KYC76985.1 hypothetical protein B4090_0214 [Bacillus licheniformis]MBU8786533.1 hypothetical protein [Bacillus glycinifermentans]MCM3754679.1 hypothetical protein [Bacillus licheniformis]MCY8009684.1 hypothetical protein [Bacillus haynesii]MCY8567383.1 hypothetical protein [Bacillus haynesii]